MVGKNTTYKSSRKRDLIGFGGVVAIIFLINFIGSVQFFRLDLTAEKRFSLSDSTKQILSNLDDIIYVRCYLEGDFNADFKRLRNSTKEILDEFKAYGGTRFDYEFINPFSDSDPREQQKMQAELRKAGLMPTNIIDTENDQKIEKLVFPGAIFTYKGREVPVQLLKNQVTRNQDPIQLLNESIEGLEYEFAKSIYILQKGEVRKQVAFSKGHGELISLETVDAYQHLSEFYGVKKVEITNSINAIPAETNLLIIAKPDSVFSEAAKYNIDQFIMRGGRVLWLIDNVIASRDSLYNPQMFTIGFPATLNLDDQLFKYGVRVNSDLVLDANCAKLPVPVMDNGKTRFKLFNWFYSPVIIPQSENYIVKNLSGIRFDFVSSIDTIKRDGIKKTVLLTTSEQSKIKLTPDRISMQTVNMPVNEELFNKQNVPVAVLLEGQFESNFKGRLVPLKELEPSLQPILQSPQTKMIVVSDGDVIKNSFSYKDGSAFPMGFDQVTGEYYTGNRNFILNCVNYLLDDSWLIPLRTKQFKIRLLDKKKMAAEGKKWRYINTLLPVLIVVLAGLGWFKIRQMRYTK